MPATLGEWRDFCALLGNSKGVAFFDKKIAESIQGRDTTVLADESQMLMLIGSLLEEDKQ